ncbi:uncharacterized protein PV09_03599 [Verruconis gallopava]|uniref:Endoglucanase n=1 Tax=Verruconis gallopava TaxID=253628 RepID=A0A0D2AFJ1_9PEZI|nr:uncharacterized protein PV09_03599 [Verruconis gallopava]KIW05743.1 hypothetical protein PV09_03599 [Verruconis gallopava]
MVFFRGVRLALLLTALLVLSQRCLAETVDLCDQYSSYNSTTVPFFFNNNAWGNDSSGYQCLDVNDGGTSFTVTYKWTGTPTLVKSYPYMKPFPSRLPVQLWNVSQLNFAADWSITVNSAGDTSEPAQAAAYDAAGLRANVAVDMFLSDNALNSTGFRPPLEIMIWTWWIPVMKPLGWDESTPDIDRVVIDGVAFSLYHGYNDRNQHVFSWLSERNLTSTNADYSPLLKYIWQKGLLSGALYLGQLEFGTEIAYASEETVFEAKNYTLQLVRQGDPEDRAASSSAAAAAATSTTTSSSLRETTPTSTSAKPASSSSVAQHLCERHLLWLFVWINSMPICLHSLT